jgi:hypothetical protein
MRCVAVSLATDERGFPAALERLGESLRVARVPADLWLHRALPDGCPSHLDAPFAFKPFALEQARVAGADFVLWLDAACVAIRSLAPLVAALERDGHLLFRNHEPRLGEWCADLTLETFALSREEAMTLPEVDAAVLGLDLRRPHARRFLERWLEAAASELPFRGVSERVATAEQADAVKWNRGGIVSADPRVRGHRHDQSVAGILAHELGMPLRDGGLQAWSLERRALAPATRIVKDRTVGANRPLTPLRRIRRDRWLGALHRRR